MLIFENLKPLKQIFSLILWNVLPILLHRNGIFESNLKQKFFDLRVIAYI